MRDMCQIIKSIEATNNVYYIFRTKKNSLFCIDDYDDNIESKVDMSLLIRKL